MRMATGPTGNNQPTQDGSTAPGPPEDPASPCQRQAKGRAGKIARSAGRGSACPPAATVQQEARWLEVGPAAHPAAAAARSPSRCSARCRASAPPKRRSICRRTWPEHPFHRGVAFEQRRQRRPAMAAIEVESYPHSIGRLVQHDDGRPPGLAASAASSQPSAAASASPWRRPGIGGIECDDPHRAGGRVNVAQRPVAGR